MTWQPSQYMKFSDARLRPAVDLLSRVSLDIPDRIYDLGCGTGNVTRLLADRWPDAVVTGVDSSQAMLAEARSVGARVRWIQEDLAQWRPNGAVDLIFSNSALHWLPDHAVLFPRLFGYLSKAGALAVQMPANFSAPSHTLIAETVLDGPWRQRLEPLLLPSPVLEPDFYHQVLSPLARRVDIWETCYWHVLSGRDPVKEWTKGTWLKQFLDALEPAERLEFEENYSARVRHAYPMRTDGTTLFPFRRLFVIAIEG